MTQVQQIILPVYAIRLTFFIISPTSFLSNINLDFRNKYLLVHTYFHLFLPVYTSSGQSLIHLVLPVKHIKITWQELYLPDGMVLVIILHTMAAVFSPGREIEVIISAAKIPHPAAA